jgi:beta-mannosidase
MSAVAISRSHTETVLSDGWRLLVTGAGSAAVPSDLADTGDWVPARVPGTVAGALLDAGRYDPGNPVPLHDKDVWYVLDLAVAGNGKRILRFEGLATIAEVYLDGDEIIQSRSMFQACEVPIDLKGQNRLAICFRALDPHLAQKGPRARWRPQLATSQGLRLVRTTLLGHMPGWCPEVHAVGPWRPIRLIDPDKPRMTGKTIRATLDEDGTGHLDVSIGISPTDAPPVLECAGAQTQMQQDENGRFSAVLRLPGVGSWMPQTHGTPRLHDVTVRVGEAAHSLGRTGFRRIKVDNGPDGKGFGLTVNGVPVFCRGAVWTNADIVNLPGDRESYRPLLELARDAGMNMLRIGGTMTYESRAFFELCDELGILVWQDFQFANYDYPVKDEGFAAAVRDEARDQLGRTQGCPSLAVLCGGSEIYQQGAMMGLPESRWKGPLCEEILAEESRSLRPDVPYAPNSPVGGALPFSPNEGIAHYYGVGAYQQPLADARRANVRFAAECLAFSNVPQQVSLDAHLPVMPGHDPRWKAGVPRDRGAGWDFEDVRDHYFEALYGQFPNDIRYGDPGRYLDLSRAVTGEVMEATFAEWRRDGSACQGALVWTFQDLMPGAGWGVIDAAGMPKPAYYALKRAFRPVQLILTDEGTNGLSVHALNETGEIRSLVLTLACLRDGRVPVVSGTRDLELAPRQTIEMAATDLFGAFFDTTYAYRFGPPSHDVTVARLIDADTDAIVAEAFHFPTGYPKVCQPLEMSAELEQADGADWRLRLHTEQFAQSVRIDVPGFSVSDDWFHLAPGAEKDIVLTRLPVTDEDVAPQVRVSALNGNAPLSVQA